MNDIYQLLANPVMLHALFKLLVIYAVFMAFASALPEPDASIGKYHWYRFLYSFVHALSMNFDKVARALKVPGADGSAQPKARDAGGEGGGVPYP